MASLSLNFLFYVSLVVLAEGGPAAYRDPIHISIAGSGPLKIAFGSCYGLFWQSSDIFSPITGEDADVFLWLGDATYIDTPD